jgi:hypothetical protein
MVINKKIAAVLIAIILISGITWIGYKMVNETKSSAPLSTPRNTSQVAPEPNDISDAAFTPAISKFIIDELIQEDIQTIRIFEVEITDYNTEEIPFFSQSEVSVMFFPKTLVPLTPVDLIRIQDYVNIVSNSNKIVGFTIDSIKPEDTNLVPLYLHLVDAPKEDLTVKFASIDGKQEKLVTLRYTEPFNYTITSENDPGIAKYVDSLTNAPMTIHRPEQGKQFTYHIHFTHDMDRENVEEKLSNSFKSSSFQAYQLIWENDSTLKLVLDFRQSTDSTFVNINLQGIRNQQGYALTTNRIIQIKPSRLQALYKINSTSSSKTNLFTSAIHYSEIEISPNGKYGLAAEVGENEMRSVYAYTVIELNGKIRKTFGMDDISFAHWSRNGDNLIYVFEKNVMSFDLISGETKTVWTSPEKTNESRIVSLDVDSSSDNIVIGWGTHDSDGIFTYDLYALSDMGDTQPRRFQSVGSFSCYEGPCYLYGNQKVVKDKMYIEVSNLKEENPLQRIAYELDLLNGEKQATALKQRNPQTDNKIVLQLMDGKSLWVQKKTEDGKEQWLLFNPTTSRQTPLMDTELGIFTSWPSLLELGKGQYLIHVQDKNWQLVDTNKKTISLYDLIPKEVYQAHKLGTHLYYFSSI